MSLDKILILIILSFCLLLEEKYLSIVCNIILIMNNLVEFNVRKIFNLKFLLYYIEICVKEFIFKYCVMYRERVE